MLGKQSPWGKIEEAVRVAEGITAVSTASHGGYKLDRVRNAQVHPEFRRRGGWYEEDCDWAIVAFTFPQYFSPQESLWAVERIKDLWPHAYTRMTGTPVSLEESSCLREEARREAMRGKVVVWSAHSWPGGMVRALCTKDGQPMTHAYLIPVEVYRKRDGLFYFNEGEYPICAG